MHRSQVADKTGPGCGGLLGSRHDGEYKGSGFTFVEKTLGQEDAEDPITFRNLRTYLLAKYPL
jgi:hypothetical protein